MLKKAHRQVHTRARGVAIYWYAWRGGPQIACFRGATLTEARDLEEAGDRELMSAYLRETQAKVALGLFGRVINDYLEHTDYTGLAEATKATKGVWLGRVRDRFGHLSPAEIDMDAVSAWLQEVEEAHGKRAADHAKSALSSVAAWGRRPRRPKESRLPAGFRPTQDFQNAYKAPPQHAWSPRELEKIPECRTEVLNVLLLALNTGLRRADLCRVAWTNVDWDQGVIRLLTSKGERRGRRVLIPLTAGLRTTLTRIGVQRDGPILRNEDGTKWTRNSITSAIQRELKRLGVKGRLHGLRRSAATHLAGQGLSSRKLARILGWSEADAEAMGAIYVDEEGAGCAGWSRV